MDMSVTFDNFKYFPVETESLLRKFVHYIDPTHLQANCTFDGCTFPKATEGEKGPPALLGVDGLLRGGLYPGTQLGENLGLVVAGREGLKLSTLWPCSGDDWAGAGVSFFSGFWGGEAWMPAKGRTRTSILNESRTQNKRPKRIYIYVIMIKQKGEKY